MTKEYVSRVNSVFIPGKDKFDFIQTLEYFDVNRVNHYYLDDWIHQVYHRSDWWDKKWSVRSFRIGYSFGYGVPTEQVIDAYRVGEINSKVHYVCDSLIKEDKENLVCNGEVELYKDEFRTWNFMGYVNYSKGVNARDAANSPGVIRITNRHQVPKSVFELCWIKGLVDYVVEFSIFDTPVGIYNKKLLIWEIRKY